MHNLPLYALQAVNELSTLNDMQRWAVSSMHQAEVFFGHGTDNAWDEARLLITHALYLPWDISDTHWACRLTEQERYNIAELVVLRIEQRMPAPYLIGKAWFCHRPYLVDERVLIPRSPIGQMIEQKFAPWWQDIYPPKRILDLCTGSGCIGIACALTFPDAQVELLDISFAALDVANENIVLHQVQDRVLALQSDVFSAAYGPYDLIVSNPPYVDAQDMQALPEEYQHEPVLALEAGDDGLDIVRTILQQARNYLSETGLLVVEVGNSRPALEAAFPELPFIWPEFALGGHGVFVLQAKDLDLLAD